MAEINKHHNFNYDTTYPEAIGDNYYTQDLLRDFNYNRHKSGAVIKNLFKDFPVLLEDSSMVNGSSFHEIDIPISKGYCYFSIEIPNDISSRPGTKMDADIIVYVESAALVDFDIQSSANLDGATVNYIKLKYKSTDGLSRTRQHGSGSYVYEKLDDYEIIVNDTSPTDYDIVLGTCVGDDSTFLTIVNYNKTPFHYISRTEFLTASKDYVALNEDHRIIIDCSSGTLTLGLFNGANDDGALCNIKIIGSGNQVNVELVSNGVTDYALFPGASLFVIWDNTNSIWEVLNIATSFINTFNQSIDAVAAHESLFATTQTIEETVIKTDPIGVAEDKFYKLGLEQEVANTLFGSGLRQTGNLGQRQSLV